MAPLVREEIDVFTIPHSRIKRLVHDCYEKIQCVDYCNGRQVLSLLTELQNAFGEFKSHESIENLLIMAKLKDKLNQLKIFDQDVCDCHDDNKLTEMMNLVRAGKQINEYNASEMPNFWKTLQQEFSKFIEDFIPHMEKEEKVFQPLLEEHFDYDELCKLKQNVLKEHELQYDKKYIYQELDRETSAIDEQNHPTTSDFEEASANVVTTDYLKPNLEFEYDLTNSLSNNEQTIENYKSDFMYEDTLRLEYNLIQPKQTTYKDLYSNCRSSSRHNNLQSSSCLVESVTKNDPKEIKLPMDALLMVFSYLQPPDRGRCAQVCSSWRNAIYEPFLWKEIYPVQWARGIWQWKDMELGLQLEDLAWRAEAFSSSNGRKWDEDADKDESDESEYDEIVERENALLQGLTQWLLPNVGSGVHRIIVDSGRAISSRILHQILYLCPNVKVLSAAYTKIDYYAFKGLGQYGSLRSLEVLDLQGCEDIDDNALSHLAKSYLNILTYPMASAEQDIEDCCSYYHSYITPTAAHMDTNESENSLKKLNLSGCFKVTDLGIRNLAASGMVDGLTKFDASGCFNLTSVGLGNLVDRAAFLNPEELSYCDEIDNGPYAHLANGCSNLCHPIRACCRTGF